MRYNNELMEMNSRSAHITIIVNLNRFSDTEWDYITLWKLKLVRKKISTNKISYYLN